MTKQKKAADKAAIEILRDGVFVAADVRKDKGERAEVTPEVAQLLIERGFARVV
jgi:hypothetical protein